jgi:hypoxanthine phosphoribosyltransferase
MREHDVKEILIDKKAIATRVDELVDEIVANGQPDRLVVVGILKGSFMFFADLMRSFYRHNAHPHIDFMTVSSYGAGTTSSGTVQIIHDIRENLVDATVLLVDEIVAHGQPNRLVVIGILKGSFMFFADLMRSF